MKKKILGSSPSEREREEGRSGYRREINAFLWTVVIKVGGFD